MTTASSRAFVEHSPISSGHSNLLRVAIAVAATDVEPAIVVWELAGISNSSVEYVLDPLAEPTEEPWPGHDNRPQADGRAEVVAYLSAEQWAKLEPRVRNAADDLLDSEHTFHVKQLPNRDWRTAWHDHFDIVRIPPDPRQPREGGNLVPPTLIIRPPHIPYDAKPNELVIDLVPGLAFGTGQHQSTRLCLRLLAEQVVGGERMLDVGTGSGILAVAAAKLGTGSVLATDIDPLAVDAARQTARQNQLSDRVEVREASIPAGQQFDLITANLTADLLQHLAPDLANALSPQGRVIASGLIDARQEEVAETLAEVGLSLESYRREDQWRAMVLSRPEPG